MRRRRFAAALGVVALLGAGCEILAGIDDRTYRVGADAGDAASDAAEPISTCAVPLPPRPTRTGDDPLKQWVFAMRRYDFSGKTDAGAGIGFDLDDVCSCDPTEPRHDAGPSCVPPDMPLVDGGCDLDHGIDNAFAPLNDQFSGFPLAGQLSTIVNTDVACGRQTLLVVLDGWDGQADDAHVTISVLLAKGIRVPHDGGVVDPDAGCADATMPWPAKFDGRDIWSVGPGDVARGTSEPYPLVPSVKGWVKDFQLVADGRTDLTVKGVDIGFGGAPLTASGPLLRARLVPLDADGNDLSPADAAKAVNYRLADGVISGRTSASDVLSTVGTFHFRSGTGPNGYVYLCDEPYYEGFYLPLKQAVCAGRDIRLDRADFQGKPCDALSLALGFDAVPAIIGDDFDGSVLPDASPCALDFHDYCDAGPD